MTRAHDPALDAAAAGDLADRQPAGQEQDDPAASDQAMGDGGGALPAFQLGALGVGEDHIDGEAGAGTGHGDTSWAKIDDGPSSIAAIWTSLDPVTHVRGSVLS